MLKTPYKKMLGERYKLFFLTTFLQHNSYNLLFFNLTWHIFQVNGKNNNVPRWCCFLNKIFNMSVLSWVPA